MSEDQKTTTSPFTLRLSVEERQKLEQMAAGQPLGTYIREQALASGGPHKRKRNPSAIYDPKAASQILGELGRSKLSATLSDLAEMARLGTLEFTPEVEAVLFESCADIAEIRRLLMKALGCRSDGDDH